VTDSVLVHRDAAVWIITINRPLVRNAIDWAVSLAVAQALDILEAREDLRVGILTGAGEHFCAGMDLQAFLAGESVEVGDQGVLGLTQRRLTKPVIAAVEGFALGGGFEVVLACDLIVASDAAKFGLPEVRRGLAATAGGLLRLPRQLPPRIAMELALTGGLIDAPRAERLGLVNALTASGNALEAALSFAQTISENAPLAVSVSKQILIEQQDWPLAEMFTRQSALARLVLQSEDAREGARAFLEKRPPVWGRT
jgi:enoyl-CoA hydratase